MGINAFINFFIHPTYFESVPKLKKAQLFVRACFLTALFSNSYVLLSFVFEFEKGVYLMIYNIVGFIILPFFVKTKVPISWLGNLYVFIGASAIIPLTYFSGGVWSAIYPWIISIPVLALLVVNRLSGALWGAFSFLAMLWFAFLALQEKELPVEYRLDLHTEWYVSILPGLLLIILFISFVFEFNRTKALKDLKAKKDELLQQKKTIAEQSNKLQKLVEEKDYIIRILAHDLRNPLSNISGLVDIAQKIDGQRQLDECLDKISISSKNTIHLVNRILEMDSLEHKTRSLKNEDLVLIDVLQESIYSYQKAAIEKDIKIVISDNCTSKTINADKTYLKLVFDNLLSNAIKFSPSNTTIDVICQDHDSYVLIKVKDEGPGVPQEEENQLFSKFSKLSARPTAGESSTGLGLALVKKYISLLDGEVSYERTPEKGATFVIKIPIIA